MAMYEIDARGSVVSSNNNQITTITFFHPAHNAMPGTLLARLAETIAQAGEDESNRVVVIQSAGTRTFCAGASFDELASIRDEQEGMTFFSGFANVINACRKCPQPVIGRIQGKAVGGGVGIAAAVDYCLATKDAAIRLSELALGIGPFVIGPAVERKIGLTAFSMLALKANAWQSAQWALEKGLYTEVFSSISELDEYLDRFTRDLAGMSAHALRALKSAFWEGTEDWDSLLMKRAEISGRLVLTDYAQMAIKEVRGGKS